MNSTFEKPVKGAEPIPGYCLGDFLGAGGFGQVWMAYAPGGFQVALKFVRLASAFDVAERRALEIIRSIRHPNLLSTFASWEIDGWLIIGMELADMTLLDRYRQAVEMGHIGIPRDELLDYFQEAARGIDFLNDPKALPRSSGTSARSGIQHRDIKPQNILLVGNGVKVADFGLARVMHHAETSHSGSMTIAYAAPEFFKKQTSQSSDQYSLAVSYCKMRTGALPFDGSVHEIIHGHTSRAPELANLPAAEQAAVARALSKDPHDRWPSCRAFVEALMASDNIPPSTPPARTKTADIQGLYATRVPGESPPKSAAVIPKSPAPTLAPPTVPPPPAGRVISPPANLPKTEDWRAPTSDKIGSGSRKNTPPALPPRLPPGLPPASPHGKSPKVENGLRSWTIGRGAKSDLIVNDAAVSSAHCRLIETVSGFFLEDLSSINGTFVNDHRINARTPVSAKDKIMLGHAVPMPWPETSHNAIGIRVITIGRDPDNDIVLDHAKVSGRHAKITVQRGVARIEDLGSTNGIAIGKPNAKIAASPLLPTDTVYFGTYAVPATRLLGESATFVEGPRTVSVAGREIVFGRDADCDYVLDLPRVSGRHARLWRNGQTLMIEDLNSTNGTLLNGQRIQNPTETKVGDQLGIGGVSITLIE